MGASPPVLGPCQWHRAYRARSRSNRGKPSVHEATRLARTEHGRPRSSPALRLAEPRFGGWGGGKRERPSGGGELCEPIEGPSRVSSYTRVPAASFRSVLTHINTRSVCTLTRHPPSPAVFVSSHFFFPSLATLSFSFFFSLLFSLGSALSSSPVVPSVPSSWSLLRSSLLLLLLLFPPSSFLLVVAVVVVVVVNILLLFLFFRYPLPLRSWFVSRSFEGVLLSPLL